MGRVLKIHIQAAFYHAVVEFAATVCLPAVTALEQWVGAEDILPCG